MNLRDALGLPWAGEFPHPTLVMGIVNVTPDSFQPQGRHPDPAAAIAHGLALLEQGADILDVGGESTRPGSRTVDVEEELERVLPVVEALASRAVVSVDTRKARVAEEALERGARLVNDVSAGRFDPAILDVAAAAGAFLCLMHAPLDLAAMRWSPEEKPHEGDVVLEVKRFLTERARVAEAAGVAGERILLDPGFGFGKTVADNLALLRRLGEITALPYPILLGTSRKSTLGHVLGGVEPEDRVAATLATVALGIAAGAAVVRVHDVREAVQAALAADAIVHGGGR
jgi:dihydropteroate synthase